MKKYYQSFILLFVFIAISYAQMFGQESSERERTYDVQNIKIEVKLNLQKKTVEGRVTTSLRSLVDNLETIKVDAVGMNIKSVKGWYHVTTDDPKSAEKFEDIKFEYDKKVISIHPRTGIKKNYPYKYQVDYSTTDPEKGLYFIAPDSIFPNKKYEVWTQGEGEDNRYWFPCYDYPNDKSTTDMIITTDAKYQTISNGKLAGVIENKDGTKTWTWLQEIKHSSYLVMLAVGNYDIIEDKYERVPVFTYVPQGKRGDAIKSFTETVNIIKFFSDKITYKYPWDRFSQVVVQDFIYGGMENTGAVVLYDGSIYDDRVQPVYDATGLVAHELAHQWWGDVVTHKNWNEIWLNEGFATYFEALYKEYSMGKDEFDYNMLRKSDEVIEADSINRKPVCTLHGLTVNTYSKGAIILNMLRNLMDETLFWHAMNLYITKNEFENVVTKDLLDAVTMVYNNPQLDMVPRDFSGFFDEWLNKAGQPEYNVSYDYNNGESELNLYVQQVQNREDSMVFNTPIDVRIITENTSWMQTIKTNREPLVFKMPLNSKLLNVIFNKDNTVLSKVNFTKPKEHWLYQLNKSYGAIDRIMAVRGLKQLVNDEDILENLTARLKSDEFWGVRCEIPGTLAFSNSKAAPQIIMNAYDNENDPRVRRACLTALYTYYKNSIDSTGHTDVDKNAFSDFILNRIKSDKNYYVTAEGISVISKLVEKEKVYDLVSPFIQQDSHNEIIRRSVLEALIDAKDKRALSIFKEYAIKGSTSRIRSYAVTGLADYVDDQQVRDILNKKLSDRNRHIRFKVVDILSKAPLGNSKPFLEELLKKTNDEELAKKIKEVLSKIG